MGEDSLNDSRGATLASSMQRFDASTVRRLDGSTPRRLDNDLDLTGAPLADFDGAASGSIRMRPN
jgi:hypothetical protein